MALPKQLKSARMTNATPANTIDTETDAFEESVLDVLGLTAGTNVNAPSYFKLSAAKLSIPMAKALAADQNTVANTPLLVAMATEEYDTDGIHDNVTNNSRLTCQTAGKYLVVAHCAYTADAVGHRAILLLKNGTEVARVLAAGVTAFTGDTAPALDGLLLVHHIALVATDYMEMTFTQNSTNDIDVEPPTFLAMHRTGG